MFFLTIGAEKPCTLETFREIKDCTYLIIEGNVSGSIPSDIGQLRALSQLTVQNTELTGTVPAELFDGTLGNTLTVLNITDNPRIWGTIPASMTSLSKLRSLHISHMPFQGTIPRSFGSCNSLTYFSMDNLPLLTGVHHLRMPCHIICTSSFNFKNANKLEFVRRIPRYDSTFFRISLHSRQLARQQHWHQWKRTVFLVAAQPSAIHFIKHQSFRHDPKSATVAQIPRRVHRAHHFGPEPQYAFGVGGFHLAN